jgi:hypothetical protein
MHLLQLLRIVWGRLELCMAIAPGNSVGKEKLMKRTIVVFHSPGGSIWYNELEDNAGIPQIGSSCLYQGQRYRVTDVTHPLGAKTKKGDRDRTGDEKLLEILGNFFQPHEAIKLFAELTNGNIGSGDQNATTAGGIVLPSSSQALKYDHVIFVQLDPEGKATAASVLDSIRQQAFAQRPGAVQLPDPDETGLEPIRLQPGSDGKDEVEE